MKKIFGVILLILIIAGGLGYASPTIRASVEKKLSYSACDKPVSYKLGSIDPRFNLSNQEVSADIKNATSILNKAEGKNLFIFDQNAKLSVNFKYDQRTALSSSIGQLKSKLDSQNESLDLQIQKYYADVDVFKSQVADLNATIEKYNEQGGAPPEVYSDLVKKQDDLKAQADALNARARELKLSTSNYNSNIHNLNQDIHQLNNAISQKPEEGLFDPASQSITIYFASSHDELIHTLAHEFGHSLGMQHVNNENAIMYSYSTPSLEMTDEDLAELSFVCRQQFLPVVWTNRFNQEIQFLVRSFSQKYL